MPRPRTSTTRTDAQRRAENKYKNKAQIVLACRMDRQTGERYKALCAERGTTPNAEIKAFILSQLGEQPSNYPQNAEQRPGKTPGRCFFMPFFNPSRVRHWAK